MYNEIEELKKINIKYGKIKLNLRNALILFSTQFIILTTNSTFMLLDKEVDDSKFAINFTSFTTLIPLAVTLIETKEISNCMNEKDEIIKRLKKKNQ